jgi:hypothetical protein
MIQDGGRWWLEEEPGSSIGRQGAHAWPTHCRQCWRYFERSSMPGGLSRQRVRQSLHVKEELVLVDDWKVAVVLHHLGYIGPGASDLTPLGLAQLRSSPVFPSPPLSRACCHSLHFSLDRCFSNSQLPSVLVHLGIDGETSPTLFLRKEQGTLAIRAQEGQDQEGPDASDISSNTIGPGSIPSHQGPSLDDAHFVLNTAGSILVCFALFAVFSSLRSSLRTDSLSLHLSLDETPAATVTHKPETYHPRPP